MNAGESRSYVPFLDYYTYYCHILISLGEQHHYSIFPLISGLAVTSLSTKWMTVPVLCTAPVPGTQTCQVRTIPLTSQDGLGALAEAEVKQICQMLYIPL